MPDNYLFLVKLNKTSFAQNPGKMALPCGRYVAEIRNGSFSYSGTNAGYSADAEISFMKGGNKHLIRFPELGRYPDMDSAQDIYQGLTIEFEHDGGWVEVYNPSPSSIYHNKCDGQCSVAIWNGDNFSTPASEHGFVDIEAYAPKGDKTRILILTSNPSNKPYSNIINADMLWQPNLIGIGKFDALIVPPEGFSLLPMARDYECFEKYINSGGRVYLSGASPFYLSYLNMLPQQVPQYLGSEEYNTVSTVPGDIISHGDENLVRFGMSVTVPFLSINDGEDQIAFLRQNSDGKTGNTWCAMKRRVVGKGKIVWSSYFVLNYDHTNKWNELVLQQIDWLIT
mgnify:CR=1 FL=1